MTIRFKLLLASLAYLAIIGGVVYFAYVQQTKLGSLAIDIYDNAFAGVDYAHKSQADFIRFVAAHSGADASIGDKDSQKKLGQILDNLGMTAERAMSDKGRAMAKAVYSKVDTLHKLNVDKASLDTLNAIDKDMDQVVTRYVNDALIYHIHTDNALDGGKKGLLIAIGVSLWVAILVTVLLQSALLPPIRRAVSVATAITEGRLDNEIPEMSGRSETSLLLNALSGMQTSIADNMKRIELQTQETAKKAAADSARKSEIEQAVKNFEKKIDQVLQSILNSSDVMKMSAESMVSDVTKTDTNLQHTISITAEASANVSAIAAAAEELSASINEISRHVARSTSISQEAVSKTKAADSTIQQLSQSAEKINEVTSLISNITGQINLLALNATIEAARAGEAGKGFAVVASEVKTLAKQTATATDAISAQINDIQKVIHSVIDVLTSIRTTINEMEEIATNVSTAVEEQGAATQEIASNIQMTSSKVQEVSTNVSDVGTMSKTTQNNSRTVLKSVQSFSDLTEALNTEIENFFKNNVT